MEEKEMFKERFLPIGVRHGITNASLQKKFSRITMEMGENMRSSRKRNTRKKYSYWVIHNLLFVLKYEKGGF